MRVVVAEQDEVSTGLRSFSSSQWQYGDPPWRNLVAADENMIVCLSQGKLDQALLIDKVRRVQDVNMVIQIQNSWPSEFWGFCFLSNNTGRQDWVQSNTVFQRFDKCALQREIAG